MTDFGLTCSLVSQSLFGLNGNFQMLKAANRKNSFSLQKL